MYVRGLARDARGGDVDLVRQVREPIVFLRNRRCPEGIRLDDVGAGQQVLIVDVTHKIGSRQHQQIVVAAQVDRMIGETLSAKLSLGQPEALDHRPHRAVEQQNAPRQQFAQSCLGGGRWGSVSHGSRHSRARAPSIEGPTA